MLDDVVIEPMSEDFILWRCLHGGALSKESIDECSPAESADREARREMNSAVLTDIIRTYGTCAMLARDGKEVVGSLRFYPKVVCPPGQLCLQGAPTGPRDHLAGKQPLPALDQIEDKTLAVHCMATGSPFQKENPYQRKGVGTKLVQGLIGWAKENGWKAIEANAVEDLDLLYEHTGMAGKGFWDKQGFATVATSTAPRGGWFSPEHIAILREQAVAAGLDPDVSTSWAMRMDL